MHVDPLDFHWLEKPDRAALEAATEELSLLGALDHQQNLTPLGHLIGDLQIDPGIAHMIYYACSKGLGICNNVFQCGTIFLILVWMPISRQRGYRPGRFVFCNEYGVLARR